MFGSRWLRNLLNGTRSRKERRRLAARNRKPFRLMLEQLEDRITPVQTAGSYTELVNAIAVDTAPNTNYVIQITNNFTFPAGGQVVISKLDATSTLTIEGQNGTNFTLTGNGNRLFDVEGKTQHVTFLDLTLTGGGGTNVSQGGAIKDQGGSVTLSSVTVRNNSVTITNPPFRTEDGRVVVPLIAGGGGVFVSGGGSLNLTNATIENNTARGIAGANGSTGDPNGRYGQGGGIFVAGTSTIVMNGGSINNNSAIGGAGGHVTNPTTGGSGSTAGGTLSHVGSGGYGQGGGLFVYGPSTISINGGSIANNSAIGGAGANGGSTSTTAEAGGVGGFAIGGAVFSSDAGWSMTLSGTSVAGNSAQGGAGGKGGTGLAGINGAVGTPGTNGTNGTATNPNGTAGGNGGNGGKGGAGDLGGKGGKGGLAEGGGAYLQGGNFTMAGATFATNTAYGGMGGTGGTGGVGGNSGPGGVGGKGGNAFATPGAVGGNGGSGGAGGQVTKTSGGKPTRTGAGTGGVGGDGGVGGKGLGGGLFVDGNTGAHPLSPLGSLSSSPSIVTIKELTSSSSTTISSFLNNFAAGGGGGVGGSGGAGGKGADGGMGGSGGTSGSGGSPAAPGNGGSGGTGGNGGVGGVGGASGVGGGGGLYVSPGSTLSISATNFQGNGTASGTGGTGGGGGLGGDGGNGGAAGGATAKSGAGQESGHGGFGGDGGVADKAQGGAIYSSSTTTILNSSLILNSTLGGQGGSGGNGGNAGNSGTGSTFNYNHLAGSVGGFGGNGAVYSPGSQDGEADGGGVYLTAPPSGAIGPDRVINTTFAQNSATAGSAGAGGATGFGGLIVNHVGMGRNGQNGALGTPGTGYGGGAYDIAATSTAFVNNTFYTNSATTQGGGIYVDKSLTEDKVPIVVNTILENNQALDSPDYWGPLSAASSFDFVSNTTNSKQGDTWTAAAPGHPLPPGTILNINTPQLENTLSWVTLPGGAKSPYFYRLLPGSLAVGAGTATVLHDIAVAERAAEELPLGAPDSAVVDESLVNPQTFDSGNIFDMGAATFFTATSTLNLSFVPNSPITLPAGATNVNVQVLVTEGTNPGSLPINGGTVTFTVAQGGTVIGVVSANVSALGLASATIPLPTTLASGQYTITASYANANGGLANPHGTFASTATVALNIGQTTPPPPPAPSPPPSPSSPSSVSPQTAALELAIYTAALLLQGSPPALLELQQLSSAFFQFTVPTTVSALVQDIQTLLPQSGGLGLGAIEAGIALAQNLQGIKP